MASRQEILFMAIWALFWLVIGCLGHFEQTKNPLLLLVSMDGFRWDYLQRMRVNNIPIPNFERLIKGGVHPKYVLNAFVTNTAPNHYTLSTGLYEENHGVIDNVFYDPNFKQMWDFHNASITADPKWYNGSPIWYVNQVHNPNYRSGVVLWPISLTPVKGTLPFRNAGPYRVDMDFKKRIEDVISWFTNHHYPINFGALYFHQPDRAGHEYGPNSTEMLKVIKKMDNTLGYLLDKIKKNDLADVLNVILTSDHGMTQISSTKIVEIDKYVSPTWYIKYGFGSIWHIQPNKGMEDKVYNQLKNIKHTVAYKRGEIPKHFHYSNNDRIMPIIIVAEEGWQLVHNASNASLLSNGNHGYSNELSSMHPFFIASGPAFKKNYVREPIHMVDIYSLMCHILKVTPGVNDGNFDRISDLLSEQITSNTTFVTLVVVIGFAALVAGIFTIGALRQTRYYKYRRSRVFPSASNGVDSDSTRVPFLADVDDEADDEL